MPSNRKPGPDFLCLKARKRKKHFDIENAVVGQPGPDGSPLIRAYTDRNGIPTIETRPKPGIRVFTTELRFLRRAPAARIIPPEPKPGPERSPARVAQMLALAHQLQDALDRGEYQDQAELARHRGFTRGRLTRLLDLTLLAPDIQEEILFLEAVDGKEPLSERALREVVRHQSWNDQRRCWHEHGLQGGTDRPGAQRSHIA